MGYDFHITRAPDWSESEDCPITAEEWLWFVEGDPESTIDPLNNGPCFALWSGHPSYPPPDEPWLDWDQGRVFTKAPDRIFFAKMLEIASRFGAKVQGDEGEDYFSLSDYDRIYRGIRDPSP